MSSYVPAWVKTNPERFPRAEVAGGRRVEALSAFAPANVQADARAFAELMRYVRARRRPRPHRDHGAGRERGRDDRRGRRPQRRRRRRRSRRRCRRTSARPLPAGQEAAGTWEQVFGRGPGDRGAVHGLALRPLRRGGRARRQGRLPAADARRTPRSTAPASRPASTRAAGRCRTCSRSGRRARPASICWRPTSTCPTSPTWCDRYRGRATRCSSPRRKNERGRRGPRAVRDRARRDRLLAVRDRRHRRGGRGARSRRPTASLTGSGAARRRRRRRKTAGVLLDKERPTAKLTLGALVLTVAHDYTFEWASPARHDPTWPRAGAAHRRRSRRRRVHRRGQRRHRHVRGRAATPALGRGHRARRRGPRRERQVRRHAPPQRRRDAPGPPAAPADGRLRRAAREALSLKYGCATAVQERHVVDPDVVGLPGADLSS